MAYIQKPVTKLSFPVPPTPSTLLYLQLKSKTCLKRLYFGIKCSNCKQLRKGEG